MDRVFDLSASANAFFGASPSNKSMINLPTIKTSMHNYIALHTRLRDFEVNWRRHILTLSPSDICIYMASSAEQDKSDLEGPVLWPGFLKQKRYHANVSLRGRGLIKWDLSRHDE